MNGEIHMHDMVALLEDTAALHFLTGQPIMLRRGQIGTVVMTYDGSAFEVEFAGTRWPGLRHPADQSRETDGVARHTGTGYGVGTLRF